MPVDSLFNPSMLLALVVGLLLAGAFLFDGIWGRRVFTSHRCPGCAYPLEGLLSRRQCPECGRRFEHEGATIGMRNRYKPAEIAVGAGLVLAVASVVIVATIRERLF